MKPSTKHIGTYKLAAILPLPLEEAEAKVRAALAAEHFGIISEIDVAAKLKEKLGIDHPSHKILGACNPKLAYQALQENSDVALALPCNIVLYEKDKGTTIVSAMLPSVALKRFKGLTVQETARKAEESMTNVFADLYPPAPNHHSSPTTHET